MNHTKNDLVFVQPEQSQEAPASNRVLMVRLTRVAGNELTGVVEKTRHLSQSTITFNASAVVLNVGPDPFPGSILGHDLRYLYRRTREVDYLGPVHFFTASTQEQRTSLKTAAKEFARLLKKRGLSFLLEQGTSIEVVSKEYAGKYAGMYRHSKDTDKRPHTIQLTLDKSRIESSSIANYTYVLAHEFGHALHFQFVKGFPKADAAWIRAYSDTVRPVQVDKVKVKSFLDLLLSAGSVSAARSDLPEEDGPLFRRVLKEVSSSAHLSTREIDKLLEADDAEEGLNKQAIVKAWPQSGVMHHELHPSVTEYALKHYQELFAESFAFWLQDRELPKRLSKLMERSVEQARVMVDNSN